MQFFRQQRGQGVTGELLKGSAAARPCYLPRHACKGSCLGTWFTVWGWIPLVLWGAWQWREAPPCPGRGSQSWGPDSEGLNQKQTWMWYNPNLLLPGQICSSEDLILKYLWEIPPFLSLGLSLLQSLAVLCHVDLLALSDMQSYACPNELLNHVTTVNFLLLLLKNFIAESLSFWSEALGQRYCSAIPQGITVPPLKCTDSKVHVSFMGSPFWAHLPEMHIWTCTQMSKKLSLDKGNTVHHSDGSLAFSDQY